MKQISLGEEMFALVDDGDFDSLIRHTWRLSNNFGRGFYAVTNMRVDGKMTTVRMHRFMMGAPRGVIVDHINRNGLDNRRENLRLADRSGNAANSKHRADRSTSPYRGVYHEKRKDLYRAQIRVRGVLHSLGRFKDATVAARKYDAAAAIYFGAFATLNFPNEVRL